MFDSLNGGVARARIVATLREWLAEEYKSKHNGAVKDFSPSSMKGTIIKVPQQPNSVDCGLFVCHYFEKFFEVSLLSGIIIVYMYYLDIKLYCIFSDQLLIIIVQLHIWKTGFQFLR